jgi:hypothetical protein
MQGAIGGSLPVPAGTQPRPRFYPLRLNIPGATFSTERPTT